MMETTSWYQRVRGWEQTSLTEIEARDYPFDFWRNYWRQIQIGGVIVNAGGIIAYYPSKFGFHPRAKFLDGRDLFGEVCKNWMSWNYARRLEIWDENNALVGRLSGPHCLWPGMVSADPLGAGSTFREMREIARRPFLLLDAQFREDGSLLARATPKTATAGTNSRAKPSKSPKAWRNIKRRFTGSTTLY